jgi:hypothetical protein
VLPKLVFADADILIPDYCITALLYLDYLQLDFSSEQTSERITLPL